MTINLSILLAVAFGGALGSVARLLIGAWLRATWPAWPWGTLMVNVIGSLAIGILFAHFAVRPAPEWLRLGLITGFLGGFTTLSALSIETIEMIRIGETMSASIYVVSTLISSLLACALGVWLARHVIG